MKISSLQFTNITNIPKHINVIILYGHDESFIEYIKNQITQKYQTTYDLSNISAPHLLPTPRCFISPLNNSINFSEILNNDIILIIENGNIKPAQRTKLLSNPKTMLISCFGGTNLTHLIQSQLKHTKTTIDRSAIQYLSNAFSNHHGLLIQELKKIQNYTNHITIPHILQCINIPNNTQYYQIAEHLFSYNNLMFWQELENIKNKHVNDITILRYLISFMIDLIKYKTHNTQPKTPIFFIYQNSFLKIAKNHSIHELKNMLIILIKFEDKLKNKYGLIDELPMLIKSRSQHLV